MRSNTGMRTNAGTGMERTTGMGRNTEMGRATAMQTRFENYEEDTQFDEPEFVKGDTVPAIDAMFDEKHDMANIGIGIEFKKIEPEQQAAFGSI